MIFKGKIKDGKIYFENPKLVKWQTTDLETDDISVSIKKWHNTRSLSQNSYYWAYLGLISKETGQGDPKQLHKFFKQEFLPISSYIVFGKIVHELGHTPKLNTKEFSEYINKIEDLTGIPAPDTQDINQLEQYIN